MKTLGLLIGVLLVGLSSCAPLTCPAIPVHCACQTATNGIDPVCIDGSWVCKCIDAGTADASRPPSDATASDDARSSVSDAAQASDGKGLAADGGPGASCVASGGTVSSSLCCGATGDFPDECQIGACGCSPSSSHMVSVCSCPAGKCFNGSVCQ